MNHDHGPIQTANPAPAFRWAVALNASYVVVEFMAGFVTGSLALIADAAHNLTDVAGLLIAWGASVLATRLPSSRFTYGFGRATILAALLNAMAILVGVGAVLWEAIQRFSLPVEVPGAPILVVALVGIVINAGTALLFRKSRHGDLNAEGAFLHMVADAAVSVTVVIAAAGILLSGWVWLDPAVAILVSLVIAWAAFGLLRKSLSLSFDGVPPTIERVNVAQWLQNRPGVVDVHDLHIWPLSTTKTALTAHLVMPQGHPGDGFLNEVADALAHEFSITHTTLQIELGDQDQCRLRSEEIV